MLPPKFSYILGIARRAWLECFAHRLPAAGAKRARQLGERQPFHVGLGGSRRPDDGNFDPADGIDRNHPHATAEERELKIDLGGIDSIAHGLPATRPTHCDGHNLGDTSGVARAYRGAKATRWRAWQRPESPALKANAGSTRADQPRDTKEPTPSRL
jgi:hypothetical protein